jgi:hypothetical protein
MLFADEPFDFDKFFNRLPAGLRLVFRSPQLFAEPYGRFMRKAFAFVRDTHLPNLCAAWPISRAPQELRLPGCVDEPLKVLKRL